MHLKPNRGNQCTGRAAHAAPALPCSPDGDNMSPSGSDSEQETTPEGMYRSTQRAAAVPGRPVNSRQASRQEPRAADRGHFPSEGQEGSDADAPALQQKAQHLGRGQRHKKASVTELHASGKPEVNKRPRRAAAQRLGGCIQLWKQHVCCHLICAWALCISPGAHHHMLPGPSVCLSERRSC